MDTITITLPKALGIELSIKDRGFDTLENMIFDIFQNIGRKVIEKSITDIDKYLWNKREKGKKFKKFSVLKRQDFLL